MQLSPEQYALLTEPINPTRVRELNGQHHVEAWDIRRYLIRTFGFGGYDVTTKDLHLVREIEIPAGNRSRWTVIYRAEVRLTIKDPNGNVIAHYEDAAMGDSQNQPILGSAHDNAMKTALSQALKRCAVNLGDQFGLSLYNKGKSERVVVRSIVAPDVSTETDIPEDAPVLGGELDETPPPLADDTPARPTPAPVPANPGALRAVIAGAGAERGMDKAAVAHDFHEWTQGQQIGACADAKLLTEYLGHLNKRPVAA